MKRIIRRTDLKDPMNGIIQFILNNGYKDPIEYKLIEITGPTPAPNFPPPSSLIYHKEQLGYGSCSESNYFEIKFLYPVIDIYVTGYGLMANALDDDVPRSWSLICLQDNIIIDEITNNKTLCPNNSLDVICNNYDKASFIASNPYKCNHIKFLQNGKSAANNDCISFVL